MTVRFYVSGRVQGVGYRYFALQAAREQDVTGYVRNLADGRVEVVARGDARALAGFEAALRQGPRLGRVDRVERAEASDDLSLGKAFAIE